VTDSGTATSDLSRRSFLGKGLLVSGGLAAAGLGGACGDSSSTSSGTTPTTTQVTNGDDAWKRLMAGNQRFVSGKLVHPNRDAARRAEQAEHQTPFAVILGCADSRVPPEIVFDEGIGDLFPVRVAGNTAADNTVLGSIEYGAAVLHSVLIVVLGHAECGAVKAAVDKVTKGKTVPGHIDGVLQPIVPAVEAVRASNPPDLVQAAIRENVRRQVQLLQTSQPILAGLAQGGKVEVIGAEYELTTGVVDRV
jgi:carbonic anhydrase